MGVTLHNLRSGVSKVLAAYLVLAMLLAVKIVVHYPTGMGALGQVGGPELCPNLLCKGLW